MLAMDQDVPLSLRSKLSLPDDYAAPLPACRAGALVCSSIRFASLPAPLDDEEIRGARTERYDPCAICQKHASDRQFERAEAQDFADRSWDILVHAGSPGDLARDFALASPTGRTSTKGLSEEPA
jgi:hypothetical protein